MPIMGEVPQPPSPIEPVQVKIHEPGFKSSLVDSKEIRPESLLVHIEGFPWTVEYYSQMLGEDEELSPPQPGQLPIYQQYLRVKQLEIRVTTPLSASQSDQFGSMEVTGSATTFPFMIPNVGDAFFADVGDGRTGVFVITSVQRMSILKQTVWNIDYQLSRYLDDATNTMFDDRVIKTVYFKKDLLKGGQYPLLIEADHNAKDVMERSIETLLRRYMVEFFSREFSTFLVPRQTFSTYDHYLTRTMLRLFDPYDEPSLRKVRELTVDGERIMHTLNIWDTILGMNDAFGEVITQKMWVIDSVVFNNSPRLEGVRFSGIRKVVYPFLPLLPVDNGYRPYIDKNGSQLVNPGDMDWELISVIQTIDPGGLEYPEGQEPPAEGEVQDTAETPLIHPVLIDEYYVFSQNFYEKSATNQSLLELLTNDVIENNAIDYNQLFRLVNDVKNWGALERFYYIPVLLALMKVKLRRL